MLTSISKEPISPFHELTILYKALGEPIRLQILWLLKHNSFNVMELCHIFNNSQPALSHHLKILSHANLILSKKEGNQTYYRRPLATNRSALIGNIFSSLNHITVSLELKQKINIIHQHREEKSLSFFLKNAHQFNQFQDLIASYNDYGTVVSDFISRLSIHRGICLEIGVGEGLFLSELSQLFQSIIAVDNNEKMLNKAKAFSKKKKLKTIEFILADSIDLAKQSIRSDCITCNMVLHHTPQPIEVVRAFWHNLKPLGSLIITDLCSHKQDWARKHCGDQWLGFEPEEISEWCRSVGFLEAENQFLSLRNGFQIQIRQFVKPPSPSKTIN